MSDRIAERNTNINMKVKITKSKYKALWYINDIGREFEVEDLAQKLYKVIGTPYLIHKEDCEIVEELNKPTVNKINSEFYFTKEVDENNSVSLTLYIDYQNKTYDFMQSNQEGILPRNFNSDTEMNKAVFELGLEVLNFIQSELYENK